MMQWVLQDRQESFDFVFGDQVMLSVLAPDFQVILFPLCLLVHH
jgi:hypothetical protein